MRLTIVGAAAFLVVISSAIAATPLAGTAWRSDECGLAITLRNDGTADFIWDAESKAAEWRMEGDQLIVERPADLREFRGRVAAPDRIEGVHSWTDVAGMIGERSCTLTPGSR